MRIEVSMGLESPVYTEGGKGLCWVMGEEGQGLVCWVKRGGRLEDRGEWVKRENVEG